MLVIDLASVRSEIELEREWRESELRFLKNHIAELRHERHRVVARKALVVMLYAHFEGLTKALFTIYVNALNELRMPVSQAHSALAAASMTELFKALRNPNAKCKLFAGDLPGDAKLHRYARDREFLERTSDFGMRTLAINPDLVVDAESNLKPAILRKILYQLGFDPALVEPWRETINQLLRRRNDVAHGTVRAGLDARAYDELEKVVKEVIDAIVATITNALSQRAYLAATSDHGLAAASEGASATTGEAP